MNLTMLRLACSVSFLLLMWTEESLQQESNTVNLLTENLRQVARQSILQQFHSEEHARLSGCSGIRQQRVTSEGTRPYFAPGVTGTAFAAIHAHPNFINTVGLGEIAVVLNGVEFTTRHNDYMLVRPSTTSGVYEETEVIEYPPVPPAVLDKPTVEEQITEMRLWFKAFTEQNYTVRDYRPYFKPVMSYLEGGWTYTGEEVDEPYLSTRHNLDAKTWYDLEEQNRYLSYSGFKHSFENIAYLPRVIVDIAANGTPIYAQWNYRMLSHPLSFDLPLDKLRLVDDLQARISSKMTYEQFKLSPKARFSILPEDMEPTGETGTYNWLLEKIMREIPGKDNAMGQLTEDGYWGKMVDPITGNTINTAYYHRRFSKKLGGAVPRKTEEHGFSDHTLFMAMTSQDKVVGLEDTRCATAKGKFKCDSALKKWTYAIPIEIIYMTPLQRWNPYDLEYKGEADSEIGKTVTADDRDGRKDKPFNGTHSKMYTQVPHGFLYDDPPDGDFPRGGFYVTDKEGQPKAVTASGITITLPTIPGVGRVRQRYPVAPVHWEGSVVWKELEALKDIVLKPKTYHYMYHDEEDAKSAVDEVQDSDVELQTGLSSGTDNPHIHTLRISGKQMELLLANEDVVVTTEQASGHTHKLKLYYQESATYCTTRILWKRCDTKKNCFDNHPKCLEDPSDQ